ncbi:MAG TPA: DUF3465 domain-containing protein [Candidatus Eremiobacteraceae bacterium]
MRPWKAAARAALSCFACALASCSLGGVNPDNASALDAIAHGQSGTEVTVEGPVVRVLSTHSGAQGVHEQFIVAVRANNTEQDVLVADNISIGRAAPVHQGDDVTVRGELAIDPGGPVIHWTHNDPRGRHQSGFVRLGGVLYD